MSAILFYTIVIAFIGSLVGLGKLGETLSKNPTIRQFCNSWPGTVVLMSLITFSFLTAMAGAAVPSTRLDLIAGGLLSFTFCFSIAVFSERTRGSRRA